MEVPMSAEQLISDLQEIAKYVAAARRTGNSVSATNSTEAENRLNELCQRLSMPVNPSHVLVKIDKGTALGMANALDAALGGS